MYSAKQDRDQESIVKTILVGAAIWLPVIAIIGAIVYVLFFQPTPTLEATYHELSPSEAQTVQLPWPADGVAAIGASGYGLLLDSGNADDPVPIASIAKLFTALAIMEEKPMGDGEQGETITFGQADEQRYADTVAENGSSYPINAGDQLTQYEALQALLIPSANNIADSLAVWAFGSEEAYLTYVNNMVEEIGLEQTVIADASGMSAESVSSPRDLITVTEAVLEDPVLSGIVSTPEVMIDPAVGTIFNTNQLLYEQYVIGVKTGTSDEAGANLIFAAEFPMTETTSETIIGVMLGQEEREYNTTASNELLIAGYDGFSFIEVVPENTTVGVYEVPWGDDVEIITHGGITVGGWLGSEYHATVEAEELEPPLEINGEVGYLQVEHGNETSSVPVVATAPIPEPSFFWRLLNIFR